MRLETNTEVPVEPVNDATTIPTGLLIDADVAERPSPSNPLTPVPNTVAMVPGVRSGREAPKEGTGRMQLPTRIHWDPKQLPEMSLNEEMAVSRGKVSEWWKIL